MTQIILASASPRRSELLKQVGIKFNVVPSEVDESFIKSAQPEEMVMELACRKALEVSKRVEKGSVVIGADTIVAGKDILGKPRDGQEAFSMLRSLSGGWHDVLTGVALVENGSGKTVKGVEKTRVKIRELSNDIIEAYIRTGEPMDKAGAYGIQGMGALLVEGIEGCYFNVVGLPLVRLSILLEEFGIKVL